LRWFRASWFYKVREETSLVKSFYAGGWESGAGVKVLVREEPDKIERPEALY
jgi:hypothetical protein